MKRSLLYNVALVFSCSSALVHAQPKSSFRYISLLNHVKAAGFYQVVLTPEIVARCVDVSRDIRILNGKGSQVPFILQRGTQQYRDNNFIEFPIVSVKREPDKQTHILIRNNLNKPVSKLLLIIKNTDANRTVTVSGSDNRKLWYVIRENVDLGNFYSPGNDRSIQFLDFPASSYKFFEIIINGRDLLPVNIVKAGVYEGLSAEPKFMPVPTPAFFQRDSSNNISYVTIRFGENFLINKLDLAVEGSKFFRRRLVIRNSLRKRPAWLDEFNLSSGAPLSFAVSIKTQQIFLEIHNEDNPPPKLTGIRAYQEKMFLLAYLDAANSYQLVFGDSLASAPSYDLEYFKDSLQNTTLQVATGPITGNNSIINPAAKVSKTSTSFLWIIIGIVLALLLVLTLQLTREVSRKKNN